MFWLALYCKEILRMAIICFLFVVIACVVIWKKSSGVTGYFHPTSILLSLAIVDVFIPGIIWSLDHLPEAPEWKDALSFDALFEGLFFYVFFYVIMLGTIEILEATKEAPIKKIKETKISVMYYATLIFSLTMSVVALSLQVSSYGGFFEWFEYKSVVRWEGRVSELGEGSILIEAIQKIPWSAYFNTLMYFGFYLREQTGRKCLFGLILPIAALLLAMTTFFRGSLLTLFLGLAFIEYIRRYSVKDGREKALKNDILLLRLQPSRLRVNIFLASSLAAFLCYGELRNYFGGFSEPKSESAIYRILSQGSGLESVSHIVSRYGESVPFKEGKTYFDMLLLPIPRILYPEKPGWYGIDDITRAMGWPESTQSAVTMPGEAYANWGWGGIFMAIVIGSGFALIVRKIKQRQAFYIALYPTVAIQLILVANWMSFTGIMNLFFAVSGSAVLLILSIGTLRAQEYK